MDVNLQVMIASTMRELRKAREETGQLSWERILQVMSQDPLVEDAGGQVDNTDELIKSSTNWFKFDGSPEQGIVEEVCAAHVSIRIQRSSDR